MRRERLFLCLSLLAVGILSVVLIDLLGRMRLAELHSLRHLQEAHRLSVLLEARESATKSNAAPQSTLSAAETLELARLRNEVTRLRNELRTATNALAPKPVARPISAQVPPPSPGTFKFTNAVTATIPLGHALVLGGWASPEPGKRLLGFITPETMPEVPGSVLVQTRIVSVPDALLDRLGLQALRAEATANQGPATFDAAQFAALLKTMEQTEGADVLSAPRVLTANGRAAQVSVVQTHADGTVTGPVVNLTPTLDASGTSVRLEVNLELSFPSPVRP